MRHWLWVVAAMVAAGAAAHGQQGATGGEWRYYAADPGSTKYSDLDLINKDNVGQLGIAWRWLSPDEEITKANTMAKSSAHKATPIMVNGVLYTSTALSQVAAINPGTGETLWVHDPESWKLGRPANTGFQHRGVGYWTDGTEERILIATGNRQLVALDAKTGTPCADFGANGVVDLSQGLGREIVPTSMGYNAPPVIVGDTIILGSVIFDAPITKEATPGHVRGFSVRSGEQLWMFRTIPSEGQAGNETWEEDSWTYSGASNVWSMISYDPELGYVYLPVSTPTNDFYGGHRKGDNLFAESLVCVDAKTGERVWHFQAIHHGLWDWDFPCAPNLVDIVVDGKPIKAVAQASKQGFLYVFDRVTGEPVWPIEERPVPQTDVPGEQTSPTQPFPTKPAGFDRQTLDDADLIDFTPELFAEAKKIRDSHRWEGMFTPPIVFAAGAKQSSLQIPGSGGGANWSGAAVDPETGIIYIPSATTPSLAGVMKPDPSRSNFDYVRGGPWGFQGPQGLPLTKPPYARITAIDLNTGEHLWMVPHGYGPIDHPLLKGMNLPRLGYNNMKSFWGGGPLLTKTLLFTTQFEYRIVDGQEIQGYLRAYDKTNGDVVWEAPLDLVPHGVPMTYAFEGRQFIVFAAGGGAQRQELIAFALSNE